jgi:DNA-binding MarR family transcriptional regulator
MPEAVRTDDNQDARIVLGLLESVERDGEQSQRKLAAELGIALGLVNAYLKRCMNKGLVKMRAIPTRRYAYYLTPQGFAEKSRLTVDYFSSSFSFFRQARADCSETLKSAAGRGHRTVALLGISDLAEIAIICAMETGMTVSAVVDAAAGEQRRRPPIRPSACSARTACWRRPCSMCV